ncbi:MAG: metal-dependent hydrolase [Candidatus Margulisbacteria bacterium]|nr:metal-dependent hydrolase [Candidatus Margulisiibacteriota bacterium]
MTYKTHVAFALLPAIIISQHLEASEAERIFFLLGTAIGALLPDLDEPGSYISKRIPIIPSLLKIMGVPHRGVTHWFFTSLFFLAAMFLLVKTYFFDFPLYSILLYGLAVGYFMHLAGDMMTKGGIDKFFYPLSNAKIAIMPKAIRFYTGSMVENILWLLFVGVDILIYSGIDYAQFI